MEAMNQLMWLKEWAFFQQNGLIRKPALVFSQIQRSFTQISQQIRLTAILKIAIDTPTEQIASSGQPLASAILSVTQTEDFLHVRSPQYALNLLEEASKESSLMRRSSFPDPKSMIYQCILEYLSRSEGFRLGEERLRPLEFVAWFTVLMQRRGKRTREEAIRDILECESIQQVLGKDLVPGEGEILMSWRIHLMELREMEEETRHEDENITLLIRWIGLQQSHFNRKVSQSAAGLQELVASLCCEVRKICQWLQLDLIKDKDGLLLDIKDGLSKSFKDLRYEALALTFSLVQAVAHQIKSGLSCAFSLNDILSRQIEYYSTLWALQKEQEEAGCYTAFKVYMRNHSVFSILSLYRVLEGLRNTPRLEMLSFEDLIRNQKDAELLDHFSLSPARMTQLTVEHYLRLSGIHFPLPPRTMGKQRFPPIRPPLYDPMHLLLVQTVYWDHPFHRKALELALWVSWDYYTKWIKQISLRTSTENQLAEYLKKIDLAVFVFLMSLQEPTLMIQYQPVEADSLRHIISQPVFPSLILDCPFFFKNRQTIQQWAVPWRTLLIHPKYMQSYIHFDRGYELAQTLLSDSWAPDRSLADFLVNCISIDLQAMGITTIASQELNRQRLEHLDPVTKKQIQNIVKILSESEQKIAQNARPLAKLLSL